MLMIVIMIVTITFAMRPAAVRGPAGGGDRPYNY